MAANRSIERERDDGETHNLSIKNHPPFSLVPLHSDPAPTLLLFLLLHPPPQRHAARLVPHDDRPPARRPRRRERRRAALPPQPPHERALCLHLPHVQRAVAGAGGRVRGIGAQAGGGKGARDAKRRRAQRGERAGRQRARVQQAQGRVFAAGQDVG